MLNQRAVNKINLKKFHTIPGKISDKSFLVALSQTPILIIYCLQVKHLTLTITNHLSTVIQINTLEFQTRVEICVQHINPLLNNSTEISTRSPNNLNACALQHTLQASTDRDSTLAVKASACATAT